MWKGAWLDGVVCVECYFHGRGQQRCLRYNTKQWQQLSITAPRPIACSSLACRRRCGCAQLGIRLLPLVSRQFTEGLAWGMSASWGGLEAWKPFWAGVALGFGACPTSRSRSHGGSK